MAARSKSFSGGENTAQVYCNSLGLKERARYEEKLAFIGGLDLFQVGPLDTGYKILPSVTYPDIVNYLMT